MHDDNIAHHPQDAPGREQRQPGHCSIERRLARIGLPLVRAAARRAGRYLLPREDPDELHSLGLAALLETMRRHDATRSRFTTHLRHRLRWAFATAARRWNRERIDPRRGRPAAAALRYQDDHAQRIVHRGSAPTEGSPSILERFEHDDLGGSVTPGGDLWCAAMSGGDNPEDAAVRRAEVRRLRVALATLPAEERALLQRHYFDDERFVRVASELGISKFAAARLHKRAIRSLRRALRWTPRGQAALRRAGSAARRAGGGSRERRASHSPGR